jgi:uridine kinase
MSSITSIVKRSGATVPFNPDRITNAIYRAAVAVGGRDRSTAEDLSRQVVKLLEEKTPPDHIPTVEEVQDAVEKVLIENGHAKVAKAYILYRDERERYRRERAGRASRPSENIPWAKLWHILDWSVAHGVHTIAV